MKAMRRIALCAVIAAAHPASGQVFDFNTLAHGEIITNQFEPALTITGTNPNRPFDIIAGFDTQFLGSTADPDLQGPPWAGGNLAISDDAVQIGTALIIAQNNRDIDNDGVLDAPNDEGSRPAGTIDLSFAEPIPAFGLDIVDIEGTVRENSSLDFYINGILLGSVTFDSFEDPNSPFYDPSVIFGNNHANRIQPIVASQFFMADSFDRVVINVGGSSAYDTFVTIPAPASSALLLAGSALIARRRR
ncbi:MAG: hypothetical protein ED559_12580 [Phycisphaera sp.]|nr:MAG: hypothetical protein ED559_12580 [Phycisphaera sp.]